MVYNSHRKLREVTAMQYITGVHALNLPCSLLTCGDWHQSALQWERPNIRESDGSLFGDYGIEQNKSIPEHNGTFAAANHIRALLDLMEQGKFTVAQGMNNDFICNDDYTGEVFGKVSQMKTLPNWRDIDNFVGREYRSKWLNYKERSGL
jgi:hypothetical protein